ncbi:hypothetical protein GH733_000882 [Mirounga leonina]|nr:hypothetical protein GH733_000882 [Mirounga leonina]
MPSHFRRGSKRVARRVLQALEGLKMVEKDQDRGCKLTPQGQRDLDRIAGQSKITLSAPVHIEKIEESQNLHYETSISQLIQYLAKSKLLYIRKVNKSMFQKDDSCSSIEVASIITKSITAIPTATISTTTSTATKAISTTEVPSTTKAVIPTKTTSTTTTKSRAKYAGLLTAINEVVRRHGMQA